MLNRFICSLISSFVLLGFSLKAQSIGQTKRSTLKYVGYNFEMQGPAWNFSKPSDGQELILTWNEFVSLPGFYEGIALDVLQGYVGEQLVIDYVFMHHLCNEGSYDYDCTGWVVSGIHSLGTPKSDRKITLPKIGKIVDPDGYVNVRSQMNVKSSVVGKLEPDFIEEECFYFYPCTDPNWMRIDLSYNNIDLKGYIHKSRIKIIH